MPLGKILFGVTWLLSFAVECNATAVDEFLKQSDAVVIATPVDFSVGTGGVTLKMSVGSWLVAPRGLSSTSIQILSSTLSVQDRSAFLFLRGPKAGIWFLKDLGKGIFSPIQIQPNANRSIELQDFYFAAGRGTTCPAALTDSSGDPPGDRIAMVLACAASFETNSPDSLGGELIRASCGRGASPRVSEAAAYLSEMPASRQKAIGIGCLISNRNTLGMTLLSQHVQELQDPDVVRFVARAVLGWTERDPALISSLGAVATNPRAQGILLKFSVTALATISSAETLPWFDKLLDREERDAQAGAISGIIRFINGYPIPTPENFRDMSFMKASPTVYAADSSWRSHAPPIDASDPDLRAAALYWKSWLRSQGLVQ